MGRAVLVPHVPTTHIQRWCSGCRMFSIYDGSFESRMIRTIVTIGRVRPWRAQLFGVTISN